MNIIICDDDIECVDRINHLLQAYIEKENINVYTYLSGEEFMAETDKEVKPDIAFLDIEMLEVSGLDIATYLKKMDENIIVFFVTSHMNYVSDTFRLGAFQFLVKPVDEKEFRYDFERAVKQYKNMHKLYNIRWRDKNIYVEYGDILYIESYNRHLYVQTERQKYECVGMLKKEEKLFAAYGFFKCHQSYLVNLNKIREIEKNQIELVNGEKIPVSRSCREDLLGAFNLYIAGKLI